MIESWPSAEEGRTLEHVAYADGSRFAGHWSLRERRFVRGARWAPGARDVDAQLLVSCARTATLKLARTEREKRSARCAAELAARLVATATRLEPLRANERLLDVRSLACCECGDGDDDAHLLLCDSVGCERGYHMRCLRPPLAAVPPGEWFCLVCARAHARAADGARESEAEDAAVGAAAEAAVFELADSSDGAESSDESDASDRSSERGVPIDSDSDSASDTSGDDDGTEREDESVAPVEPPPPLTAVGSAAARCSDRALPDQAAAIATSARSTSRLQTTSSSWCGHDMSRWPPSGIARATLSWLYMPLIFDALGIAWPASWSFPRAALPAGWAEWTDAYRASFAARGVTARWVLTHLDSPSHLSEQHQNLLIDSLLWDFVNDIAGAGAHFNEYGARCRREAANALLMLDGDGGGGGGGGGVGGGGMGGGGGGGDSNDSNDYADNDANDDANDDNSDDDHDDGSTTTRFLRSISLTEREAVVARLTRVLARRWGHKWRALHCLLDDPTALVRGWVDSYAETGRPPSPDDVVALSSVTLVNGDVQRGKTLVEALYGLLGHRVWLDPTIGDRPCTLLGTPMVPWARSLHGGVSRHLHAENDDGDDDSESNPTAVLESEAAARRVAEREAASMMPRELIITVMGSSDAEIEHVIERGGVVIFARTCSQIERLMRVTVALAARQRSLHHPVSMPTLVLDEADRMLGTGEAQFKYEIALRALRLAVGFPAVVEVSATNAQSVFEMMMRLIDGDTSCRLRDVFGFRAPSAEAPYLGFPRFEPFTIDAERHGLPPLDDALDADRLLRENDQCTVCLGEFDAPARTRCGHVFCLSCARKAAQRSAAPRCPLCRAPLELGALRLLRAPTGTRERAVLNVYLDESEASRPRPANEYVCDRVLDLYDEVARTPWSCVVDCLARGVQYHVQHNMQDHVTALVEGLARRSSSGRAPDLAFVVMQGGHLAHVGMIGVRLVGENAERNTERLLAALNIATRARGEAAVTRDQLVNQRGWIEQERLRPLLCEIDTDAARLNPGSHARLCDIPPMQRLSNMHLPLTLFVLRHLFGGIPIALVGSSMIRRCVSIVAPNLLRRPDDVSAPEMLLCATHIVLNPTAAANAPDVVQQFLRPATTAAAFYALHGFSRVRVLAPARVWTVVRAAVAFNSDVEWISVRRWRACEQAIADGAEPHAALLEHFAMPRAVRPLFEARNPMHIRARRLTALAHSLVAQVYRRGGEEPPAEFERRRAQFARAQAAGDDGAPAQQCSTCNAMTLTLTCGHDACPSCAPRDVRDSRGGRRVRQRVDVCCPVVGCAGRSVHGVAHAEGPRLAMDTRPFGAPSRGRSASASAPRSALSGARKTARARASDTRRLAANAARRERYRTDATFAERERVRQRDVRRARMVAASAHRCGAPDAT